jgi:hypothetical protein
MHLREALGAPFHASGVRDQLAGRALACAALDCCHLGNAQVRALTRTLTAAVAVPAGARPRPQSSSASGELPESVS